MIVVKFELTNDEARYTKYALQKLYSKDGRATLNGLAKMAVLTEAAKQAKLDLDEAERKLNE